MLPDDLAGLEDHKVRNGAHPEPGAQFRFGLGIHLEDQRPAGNVLCKVVEDGRDHAARPAPRGPEVDEDRLVG